MEVVGKGLKVIELSANVAVNADMVAVVVAHVGLECAEKATSTQDGKNLTAEFPHFFCQDLRETRLAPEFGENGAEAFVAMRGKFESLTDSIN
jgi:hypothetical protein